MVTIMASKTKVAAKSLTGKRYTDAEKAEVLKFIEKANSEKGRGGQSAAAKKFGISQLTLASWLRTGGIAKKPGRKPGSKGSDLSLSGKLTSLAKLHEKITQAEKDLQKLKTAFSAVKASL